MFLAPTRPLVEQQLRACRERLDIPDADIVELQASNAPERRQAQWEAHRVFFCTPQILENDIKRGICPEEQVRCGCVGLNGAGRGQGGGQGGGRCRQPCCLGRGCVGSLNQC